MGRNRQSATDEFGNLEPAEALICADQKNIKKETKIPRNENKKITKQATLKIRNKLIPCGQAHIILNIFYYTAY